MTQNSPSISTWRELKDLLTLPIRQRRAELLSPQAPFVCLLLSFQSDLVFFFISSPATLHQFPHDTALKTQKQKCVLLQLTGPICSSAELITRNLLGLHKVCARQHSSLKISTAPSTRPVQRCREHQARVAEGADRQTLTLELAR